MMLNFFINLLNYFFLILYCFIFYKKNFLSKNLFFFLAITSLFSLVFNNFIFIDTFPDQIRFFSKIQDYRNLNFTPSSTPEVTFVSFFLSILPIPFIVDHSSAALLNRLLLIIFVCYLYKKKINENFIILIGLSPSIIIYSNLILKDLLALILCCAVFIELKQKKIINYFILIFLLFNVKSNLALMIIPLTFLYYIYKYKKNFFLLFLFSYFIIAGIYLEQIIEIINFNTFNLHKEDNNYSITILEKNFLSLFGFLLEFLRIIITMEPLKNISSSVFYLEMLFFLFLIIFFLMKNFLENKRNLKICLFWILNLFLILNMYSHVISNVFTLFRYTIVILIPTVIILYMETKKIKIKN